MSYPNASDAGTPNDTMLMKDRSVEENVSSQFG